MTGRPRNATSLLLIMKILQTITVLTALVYACAAKQDILQESPKKAGSRWVSTEDYVKWTLTFTNLLIPCFRPFELASLSHQEFTTFSNPVFPGRSLRIKKSKFCDGGVKCVTHLCGQDMDIRLTYDLHLSSAYTGYIDVNANHFFFYFFESRNDPDTDDVVLWTNGGEHGVSLHRGIFQRAHLRFVGPGGSSTMGLFLELGASSKVLPSRFLSEMN